MARPSRYKAEFAEQAAKLCRLGATDEQIAWFFDVDINTLAMWAWGSEEFFNAITPDAATRRQWIAEKSEHSAKRSAVKRRRMEANPHERIANSMRARMWAALKGKTGGSCLSRLGYGLEELKRHIEANFAPGMAWDNYGKWHIDHIRPCASFDLTDENQIVDCWALSNLQPLWASDNVRKGAKYDGS